MSKEDWAIDTWETDDGLPENSATAMVQTPDGYLWFGTFKGLVRFDGVRFTVFDHWNVAEFPSDGIVNLYLDRAGRLWVSTLAGLLVRDPSGWRVVRKAEVEKREYIRTFAERQSGDLLLTTFGGKVFEIIKDQLKELPTPPGEPGGGYFGAVDEEGQWWVAQSGFIGRLRSGRWEAIVPAAELAGAKTSQVGMAPAHGDGIWVLLNSELRKYLHGAEISRQVLQGLPDNVWDLEEDSRGTIWISTIDQGLFQVLPDARVLRWTEKDGLSYAGTRFVFEDRENNLWVGTSGGGLQRLKLRRIRTFGPESGLSERVVKSVSPDGHGGLWIGTYGKGLFRWTEGGITNVLLGSGNQRNLYVQSILKDRKDRTWVGTYGAGLFLLEGQRSISFSPGQTGGENIIALFEDSTGRIWISGGNGVSVYEDGGFRIWAQGQRENSFPGVCSFGESSDGVIWLSNLQGVYRAGKNGFEEVKDDEGNPLTGIACLKGDESGAVWMGSTGAGILRWRTGKLSRIGVEQGLAAAAVHGILYDDQGTAWLPGSRGIIRVQRKDLDAVADGRTQSLTCQLLDRSDGLVSVECPSGQQPTCARDGQGRLWFATMKGVAMLKPSLFRSNSVAPTVLIEEVVFRKGTANELRSTNAYQRIEGPFPGPVQLPTGSHGIEIRYTAPSFVSPKKVKFQINLDGEDLDWLEVGPRRTAYFEELKPGRHVFQVRAANDDGLWNQSSASLTLTVLPFFYQTGAFRVLIGAGLFGVVLLWAYRLKARFEERKAAHQAFTRQLICYQEDERKRVASELHDGLGQDLMLIKNRLGMISAGTAPEITRQIHDISAITSRTISEVRSISHALRPSALEQVGLTKAIEWLVEQIAEASRVKFSTELENIDGLLAPEMEINLYRILQEALNNVLKHAQASEVIVEVKRQADAVFASVFDNGQGFEWETPESSGARPEGFGLISMAERARVLGGQLDIRSTKGVGTRLTLQVPVAITKNGEV